MSEESKGVVKFLTSHAVYVRGDIAGFDPAHAEALVKAGVATTDLDQPLGGAEAAAAGVDIAAALAEKDAQIAALREQLAAKAGKSAAPAKDAGAGAGTPPTQGGGN